MTRNRKEAMFQMDKIDIIGLKQVYEETGKQGGQTSIEQLARPGDSFQQQPKR